MLTLSTNLPLPSPTFQRSLTRVFVCRGVKKQETLMLLACSDRRVNIADLRLVFLEACLQRRQLATWILQGFRFFLIRVTHCAQTSYSTMQFMLNICFPSGILVDARQKVPIYEQLLIETLDTASLLGLTWGKRSHLDC